MYPNAQSAPHMRHEMAAQPEVVRALLAQHADAAADAPCRMRLPDGGLTQALAHAQAILVSACGSSRHAAIMARPAFLHIAELDVRIEYAHEVPNLAPALTRGAGLCVSISQSGETGETCVAQRHVRALGCPTVALVANTDCTLARESLWALSTCAGTERAIPSTKGFIAQASLCLLMAVACHDLRRRPWGPAAAAQQEAADALWAQLQCLPDDLDRTLAAVHAGPLAETVQALAARLAVCRQALCLGIGAGFAAACEGALKLKEAAYVPASAYLLPEFRHGPQAMVEAEDVLIALWPGAKHAGGPPTRLRELAVLGVPMAVVCPAQAAGEVADLGAHIVVCATPDAGRGTWPLVATVVLQALARITAAHRHVDADAPRYLVKSVVAP